jgi:hypothetical protein
VSSPQGDQPAAREIATLIAREVRARCGENATLEQRQDVVAMVAQEVLANWRRLTESQRNEPWNRSQREL